MLRGTNSALLALTVLMTIPPTAEADSAIALYDGRTVAIGATLADPTDLWVGGEDLTAINDFELKPEGACYEDLCVPIRQSEDGPLFVTREDQGWVNVSELARRLQQSVAHDSEHRVWSFGEIPAVHQSYLRTALAPDFELPNRAGEAVRLSDFRGKKVLLMTWASW